ncbi:VirB3 family type IV secretion system protein (plasmid) [Cupriavidus basilensis]
MLDLMRQSVTYLALQRPMLSGGIGLKAMAMIWPGAALACFLATSPLPLAAGFLLHGALRWAYRKDPQVIDIYLKYAETADHYQPHVRERVRGVQRPVGYGRGVRC